MQLEYDKEADALYIYFQKKQVYRSKELSPGIILDLDKQGRPIGLEVLDVSEKVPQPELTTLSIKKA
ncbi:MAG: DUF2283 domain-containing protein [Candidatus Doudnabacteria bacterium]|nr:DUF2283 domain-containing protein [Candidatus Doudnabacteria bacterium]